jgi:exodeoxyribonuclease VII small subunit
MTKTSPFPLQEKVKRLEEIETYFQQADMDLEKALVLHEEALTLAKAIQDYLKTAQQKLEKIDIASLRREA